MRSRLVLLVLTVGAILASIAVTMRGYAASSLPSSPKIPTFIFLPFTARYPNDLPPPLEPAAVGRLRVNSPTPSLCAWGTHHLEGQDGQLVAWVKSDESHPISFEGYLGLFVRVVGVAVAPVENCPPQIKQIIATDVKPWGLATPQPEPSPTPPD